MGLKRKQKKKYIELEKRLEVKFKNVRENELVLTKDDFKDGKLLAGSFERIKNECYYIPYEDEVEIKMPQKFLGGFCGSFELMSHRELSKLWALRREAWITALILILAGIGLLIPMYFLYEVRGAFIIPELLLIASWVFVWAAVQKVFFDRWRLREQRFTLLQLLDAKVVGVDE